uniref:Reverse transcriptase Ty1/copia-type domain-containing protein n=1 Tax=Cannabis sativa TaxID=3483 RepID=A0A803PTP6_CANSA
MSYEAAPAIATPPLKRTMGDLHHMKLMENQEYTSKQWNQVMTDKIILALTQNGTYTLVPLPERMTPIGWKWVFREKENSYGIHYRYKARLVANDFHQQLGFDFTITFSLVVNHVTIRLVLTLALSHGWSIKKLDVNNAYLIGTLKEKLYMVQPPGFEIPSAPHLVCKHSG